MRGFDPCSVARDGRGKAAMRVQGLRESGVQKLWSYLLQAQSAETKSLIYCSICVVFTSISRICHESLDFGQKIWSIARK
jgi:hypothetical protein